MVEFATGLKHKKKWEVKVRLHSVRTITSWEWQPPPPEDPVCTYPVWGVDSSTSIDIMTPAGSVRVWADYVPSARPENEEIGQWVGGNPPGGEPDLGGRLEFWAMAIAPTAEIFEPIRLGWIPIYWWWDPLICWNYGGSGINKDASHWSAYINLTLTSWAEYEIMADDYEPNLSQSAACQSPCPPAYCRFPDRSQSFAEAKWIDIKGYAWMPEETCGGLLEWSISGGGGSGSQGWILEAPPAYWNSACWTLLNASPAGPIPSQPDLTDKDHIVDIFTALGFRYWNSKDSGTTWQQDNLPPFVPAGGGGTYRYRYEPAGQEECWFRYAWTFTPSSVGMAYGGSGPGGPYTPGVVNLPIAMMCPPCLAHYTTNCPDWTPKPIEWQSLIANTIYSRASIPPERGWRWLDGAEAVVLEGNTSRDVGYTGWWVIPCGPYPPDETVIVPISKQTVREDGLPHPWWCDETHLESYLYWPTSGPEYYDLPEPAQPWGQDPIWVNHELIVSNLGVLKQPYYPLDDPLWGDWRVPLSIVGWDWNALTVRHYNDVTLWSFDSAEPYQDDLVNCSAGLDGGLLRLKDITAGASATGDHYRLTTLTADCLDDDATLYVADTTGFPESGDLLLMPLYSGSWTWDAVTYAGKTGTTFTGCQGVKANSSGERVELIGPWLSHYRYVRLDWEARDGEGEIDESAKLRVWFGEKWWDLAWSEYLGDFWQVIDLCKPHGGLACDPSSEQQSMLNYYLPRSIGKFNGNYIAGNEGDTALQNPNCEVTQPNDRTVDYEWYWGVDKVNVVKFSELTEGDTYTIRTIKGELLSPTGSVLKAVEQWGWRRARDTDNMAKLRSGIEPAPDNFYYDSDEIGWVLFADGRPAAEITGHIWQERTNDGTGCCDALHFDPLLKDIWVFPRHPRRSPPATFVVGQVGGTGYLSNDRDMRHLRLDSAVNVSESLTTLTARIRCDMVRQVLGSGTMPWTFDFRKRFRHRVCGLVFEGDKPRRSEAVKVECGEHTRYGVTNYYGHFAIDVPRKEDDGARVSLPNAAGVPSVMVPVRQRRMSFCGIGGTWPVGALGQGICWSDGAGRAYAIYGADDGLKLRVYGRGGWSDRQVTEDSADRNPKIDHAPGRKDVLWISYETDADGSFVGCRSTDSGRTWGAEVSIATGYHGCICLLPAGVVLAGYYSGGAVYAKRSRDAGLTWSAAITVVPSGAADDNIDICAVPGRKASAWLVYRRDSDNALVRMISDDGGKTWAEG